MKITEHIIFREILIKLYFFVKMLNVARKTRIRVLGILTSIICVALFSVYYLMPAFERQKMQARIVMNTKRIEKLRKEESDRLAALAIEVTMQPV